MNVIPIPSPGLGRIRVGGLASQTLSVPRGSMGWGFAPNFWVSTQVGVDGFNLLLLG